MNHSPAPLPAVPCLRPGLNAALGALFVLAVLCGTAAADAATQPSDAPAASGPALAQDKGCMRCHSVERRYVGPSFQQVAERYRASSSINDGNDALTTGRLANRIRQGSVGAWGRVIMPRQPQVTEAEAAVLAGWVRSLRPAAQ